MQIRCISEQFPVPENAQALLAVILGVSKTEDYSGRRRRMQKVFIRGDGAGWTALENEVNL
jgi:hypothetical protein